MDGYLESCLGAACNVSCCLRGYAEPLEDFQSSKRSSFSSKMESLGIHLTFQPGRVWYDGCSDGIQCKILYHFGPEDNRSLECKIFPYKRVEVREGDTKKRKIGIYLRYCPATGPDFSVPHPFTEEVIRLVKSHYLGLFHEEVDVEVIRPIQEC